MSRRIVVVRYRFVRRLLYYFKPSNNKFSTTELSSELHRKLVVVGLHFTELMATCDMVRVDVHCCRLGTLYCIMCVPLSTPYVEFVVVCRAWNYMKSLETL